MSRTKELLTAIENVAFDKLLILQAATDDALRNDYSEISKAALDTAKKEWDNARQLLITIRDYIEKRAI